MHRTRPATLNIVLAGSAPTCRPVTALHPSPLVVGLGGQAPAPTLCDADTARPPHSSTARMSPKRPIASSADRSGHPVRVHPRLQMSVRHQKRVHLLDNMPA